MSVASRQWEWSIIQSKENPAFFLDTEKTLSRVSVQIIYSLRQIKGSTLYMRWIKIILIAIFLTNNKAERESAFTSSRSVTYGRKITYLRKHFLSMQVTLKLQRALFLPSCNYSQIFLLGSGEKNICIFYCRVFKTAVVLLITVNVNSTMGQQQCDRPCPSAAGTVTLL